MTSVEADGLVLLGNEIRPQGESRDPARLSLSSSSSLMPTPTRPPALVLPPPHAQLPPQSAPAARPFYMPLQLITPILTPQGAIQFVTVVPMLPISNKPLTDRQKKVQRFRERRAMQKLRVNQPPAVDVDRSRRAKAQPRGEHGFFISEEVSLERRVAELKKKLNQSESEALALRARLSTAEQELHQMQLITSPEQASAQPSEQLGAAPSPTPAATPDLTTIPVTPFLQPGTPRDSRPPSSSTSLASSSAPLGLPPIPSPATAPTPIRRRRRHTGES